jgi:hypothetical protein
MAAPPHGAEDGRAPLEALRRRLYRAGTTDEDVARYRGALPAAPPESPQKVTETGDPGGPRGSRRRFALLVPAVLAVAAAVLLLMHAWSPSPSKSLDSVLAVPATTRTGFVRALESGRTAGIAHYFYEHPEGRPADLLTPIRTDTQEHAGTGPRTIALAPSAAAGRGGRMTVLLVLARTGAAGWSATREGNEVAARSGELPAGSPSTTTITYSGAPPTRLHISTAAGARWGAVIVFSD